MNSVIRFLIIALLVYGCQNQSVVLSDVAKGNYILRNGARQLMIIPKDGVAIYSLDNINFRAKFYSSLMNSPIKYNYTTHDGESLFSFYKGESFNLHKTVSLSKEKLNWQFNLKNLTKSNKYFFQQVIELSGKDILIKEEGQQINIFSNNRQILSLGKTGIKTHKKANNLYYLYNNYEISLKSQERTKMDLVIFLN